MTGFAPELLPDQPFDPWNFRPDVAVEVRGARLAGCTVDAIDGRLGKVLQASLAPEHSYLVVTTRRWLGIRLQLPAGTVGHVDPAGRTVYLDRTRSQVKAAPRVPPEGYDDPGYRDRLADYYRATYHPASSR